MNQLLQLIVAGGALMGVYLAITRPHWAVVLIIALFPMEQLLQNYLAPFRQYTPLYNFFVATLTSLALVMQLTRGRKVFSGFFNPLTFLIFALYVLWSAGLLYTPSPAYAYSVFEQSVPYQILKLLIFPLLILNFDEFRKTIPALLIVGTATCILILMDPSSQYMGGRLMVDTGTAGRFGNPLAIAELGGLSAMAAALYLPIGRGKWLVFLRLAAFFAGFAVAIGSGSRGQVFAATFCGIIFYPVARRLHNPKQFLLNMAGLGLLLVGIYFVFNQFIGYENQQRWDTELMRHDVEGRWLMVRQLLDAFADSPGSWLFGLGPGAYNAITGGTGYVHNVPAEILCEHGIVGAAIFILIMFFTLRCGRGLWLMFRDDPSLRAIAAILFAISLSELILACKQGSISDPTPFYWWMIVGKMYYHHKQTAENPELQLEHVDDEAHGNADEYEYGGEAIDPSYGPGQERDYALGY